MFDRSEAEWKETSRVCASNDVTDALKDKKSTPKANTDYEAFPLGHVEVWEGHFDHWDSRHKYSKYRQATGG